MMGKIAVNIIAVMLMNISGSDDQRGDSNVDRDCEAFQCGSSDCEKMAMIMMIFVIIDMMIFVIIDIIQVAQKQKELQARFKELEKQEQV